MLETMFIPEKVNKTFVFQKEETHQSTIVEYEIDMRPQLANLKRMFFQHCHLIYHKVSIYNPNHNQFVSLDRLGADQTGMVPTQYLQPAIILIRFAERHQFKGEDSQDESLSQGSQASKKNSRNKERTIGQVIQLVRKWRFYHLQGIGPHKRRVNLQEAAKLVGISKKSLDDYYCQLRLGEFYQFNFEQHANQKMGALRAYVKNFKPQKDKNKHRNQKYPKILRVIDEYQMPPVTLAEQKIKQEHFQLQMVNQEEPGMLQLNKKQSSNFFESNKEDFPPFLDPQSPQFFNLEHQFFRGFESVQELGDFYDVVGDFKKKDYHESDDSYLYF